MNVTNNVTATTGAAPALSIYDGGSPIQTPLTIFLIQLLMVMVVSKLLAFLFKFIKQPPVIAEVVAGIILGPSVFGQIHDYLTVMWTPASMNVFNVVANWGLIIFMYMVGLEIDTKIMKRNAGAAIGISVSAMILPFCLGIGSSWVIHDRVGNPNVSFSSFLLFVAVAMSITAFPVLARILTETKLLHTKVGTLSLSAAAVDDVTAWCLLALVVAYARATKTIEALWTFLILIGFIIFMVVVVRPFINSFAKRRHQNANIKYTMIVCLLGGMFLCSWFTEIIGVHAIFGSFVLGIVTPRRNGFAAGIMERLEDLVVIVMLPLYFTFSGLRTNIGSLNKAVSWGLVILAITTACVGKIVGATCAARLVKLTWRESFTVGILMNTKGLVELIVLNVGKDAGVLNTEVFTMFVIMALVTTFLTTPLLHLIYLRHLPKEHEDLGKDTFSLVLATVNSKTAPMMVACSSLFMHVKENLVVKTIFLTEISDRPSSYFFSEFYSTFQAAPVVGGRQRKGVLLEMHRNAKEAGINNLETKNLASADIAAEVSEYVASHNNSMVMFDMHISPSLKKAPSMMHSDMRASISAAMDSGVQKVFSFGAAEALITTAIKRVAAPISILIHKTSDMFDKVDRVLFLYTGAEHERTALEYITSIKLPVVVTVVTPNADAVQFATDRIVVSANPLGSPEFREEAAKGHDLIVMGASRDSSWDGYNSEPVIQSKVPVLLVFPPKFANLEGVQVELKEDSPRAEKYTFKEEAELP
eukprot:TRINITY_DN6698_c0_g3_i1.p1 TRINITY_DN6698_c0_g3~~TRINITY_DN6698_c0_g3_i1.p1  ORF type:complete len:757 (-),score=198.52 TRINITY_DN6698_c0_g3_i1:9-2279(-)